MFPKPLSTMYHQSISLTARSTGLWLDGLFRDDMPHLDRYGIELGSGWHEIEATSQGTWNVSACWLQQKSICEKRQ